MCYYPFVRGARMHPMHLSIITKIFYQFKSNHESNRSPSCVCIGRGNNDHNGFLVYGNNIGNHLFLIYDNNDNNDHQEKTNDCNDGCAGKMG